ncbi:unnamed protein product [Clonostachys rosea f. rosea IK726]|uniref:Uncharacterized protein n=1 Tax=Clonostachys rosea f. rosea IK726 TaxID=1349383 RepID=A0ACA9UV02_BIOOC|nr:unnamed protein product [Clonostachys rosea f. rosea IK726]
MYIKALSHFQGPLQKHKSKTSTDIIPANMSTPRFSSLPGAAGTMFSDNGIAHAVVLPANSKIVITSGEPGLDLDTGKVVTSSVEAQFRAAFNTVDAALKNAGVKKGIRAVYKFTVLMIDMKEEDILMQIWQEVAPGQQAVFMAFGVNHLGLEGMRIELRAEAILEE